MIPVAINLEIHKKNNGHKSQLSAYPPLRVQSLREHIRESRTAAARSAQLDLIASAPTPLAHVQLQSHSERE